MNIHLSAVISPNAKLGKNVTVGSFTTIHDNVVIGDNCIIEGYCEIGVSNSLSQGGNLVIGNDSHIRSHSIFYENSQFGSGLVTGHRVTVREKTRAGSGLQIGTLSDVQGHCEIGDYVRLHSNVHIGQHSIIGNYVWLFPYVVLTNDPHPPSNVVQGVTLKDYSVIATMSVILPGVTIAKGCLIGAGSVVGQNTQDDMLYSGNPAKKIGLAARIRLKDGTRKPAYPWTNHFHRGYPEEIVNKWVDDFTEGDL
jgi:UDP-3-O-[3-hydroxymyristoyl] glucosamine N-acyltransferase